MTRIDRLTMLVAAFKVNDLVDNPTEAAALAWEYHEAIEKIEWEGRGDTAVDSVREKMKERERCLKIVRAYAQNGGSFDEAASKIRSGD